MYVIVYIIQNSNPFFSSSEINNDRNKEYKNLGASAEIIQILFFLLTILLMGFYKTGVGVIKKKMRK